MPFLRGFIRHPRKVWLRMVIFQVHLWAGLIFALYLVAIGLTGSILVFREDFEAMANPWRNIPMTGARVSPAAVVAKVRAAFPHARLVSLAAPVRSNPVYVALLQGRGRYFGSASIAIHPESAQVLGRMPRGLPANLAWLGVVRNFHETLLSGRVGRQTNGVLAAMLVLINLTGIVVWWPGLIAWKQALRVDFASGWRRVNFDLHRTLGFWMLAIVSLWGISGFYFGWSGETRRLVNRISPLVATVPPSIRVEPRPEPAAADLDMTLATAARLDPGATLRAIAFPSGRSTPLEISMQRPRTRGAEFADTLYFDPWDGRCLGIWKYGVNQSIGDWLVWSQIPLHFGTFWGFGVKIVWAVLGLSIPLLSVTGVLMYWNRALRRKWKRIRARSRTPVLTVRTNS